MIQMIQKESLDEVDLKMTSMAMIHLVDPDLALKTLMTSIFAKVQDMIQMIQREDLEEVDPKMMALMIHLADPDQAQN